MLQQQLEEQGAELREVRQNLEWRERELNTLQEERTRSEQLLQQQLQAYKERAETQSTENCALKSILAQKETEL